jgi:signal transduction histidine kinase
VSDSAALWWAFVAGVLAVVILVAAFGIAVVIYQRRYARMHRAYAQRLLEAQEEERAWVAREVHDDALQRIALVRHECSAMGDSTPGLTAGQADQLDAIQQELADLAVSLRAVAHRLHPALIDKGGLHAALAGLPGEMERGYGLRVEARVPDAPIPVDPHRALAIYRIAQEALRNAATHAGAPAAALECRETAAGIELTISDRGRGFELGVERRTRGLGLTSMRERAHLAGASLTITSRPGRGTTVRAVFPSGVGAVA